MEFNKTPTIDHDLTCSICGTKLKPRNLFLECKHCLWVLRFFDKDCKNNTIELSIQFWTSVSEDKINNVHKKILNQYVTGFFPPFFALVKI